MGFASVLTVGQDATPQRYHHSKKGKGKKKERVAMVGGPTYTPVKVLLSRDAHL